MFVLFYGVMTGVGIGMLYLPSITIINTYFEKKRGLILGMVTSGSGVGLLVMSLLIEFLTTRYGWRGAYLIIGGIYLHLSFFACLMRPLRTVSSTSSEEQSLKDAKEERGVEVLKSGSPLISKSSGFKEIEPIVLISQGRNIREIGSESKTAQENEDSKLSLSSDYNTINSVTSAQPLFEDKSYSIPIQSYIPAKSSTKGIVLEKTLLPEKCEILAHERGAKNTPRIHSSQPHLAQHEEIPIPITEITGRTRSQTLTYDPPESGDGQYPDGLVQFRGFDTDEETRVRLGGAGGGSSLSKLFINIPPQCMSLSVASVYTRSRNQINGSELDYKEEEEETGLDTDEEHHIERVNVKTHPANTMMALLRDPSFVLFCLSAFLIQLANSIPPMFAPSYARSLGLDSSQAAQIVSIIGISNTIGRLLTGVLSYCGINNLFIYATGTSIAGLLCFAIPVCTTYGALVAFAVGQGLFIGVFPPLQSVILVELLGLERLPSSFGIMCFCKSIASVAGPSMGGGLYQAFQDYSVPFLFAAGIITLANILHIAMVICRRRHRPTKST